MHGQVTDVAPGKFDGLNHETVCGEYYVIGSNGQRGAIRETLQRAVTKTGYDLCVDQVTRQSTSSAMGQQYTIFCVHGHSLYREYL